MPEFATLVIFAAACLALTASPGPDMLLIASRSVSQGRRAGFASLAGIQVGTYCHALAAAFGLSQLFVAVPMAYDAVRYAGAAYLLFLAWQTFRANGIIAMPTGEALHYSPVPAGFAYKSSEPKNGAIRIGPIPAVCKTGSRFGRRTDDDPCDRAQHHWSCRKRCRHSRREQVQSRIRPPPQVSPHSSNSAGDSVCRSCDPPCV